MGFEKALGNSLSIQSLQPEFLGGRGNLVKRDLTRLVMVLAALGVFSQTAAPAQASGLPPGPGWHRLPNTHLRSVCLGKVPDGMFTDDTMTKTTEYDFDCNQIIPWSGGAADDAHQRLIMWGGGHSDYAGNEVSVLNLTGTPSWERFTSPTMPVPFVGDGKYWEGLKPYYNLLHHGGQ